MALGVLSLKMKTNQTLHTSLFKIHLTLNPTENLSSQYWEYRLL